jgi:hypothetical protein
MCLTFRTFRSLRPTYVVLLLPMPREPAGFRPVDFGLRQALAAEAARVAPRPRSERPLPDADLAVQQQAGPGIHDLVRRSFPFA